MFPAALSRAVGKKRADSAAGKMPKKPIPGTGRVSSLNHIIFCTMKFFSPKNFLLVLVFLAILHSVLESFELSDTAKVTLFVLTFLEIRLLDFFMEKGCKGWGGHQHIVNA